MFAVEGGGRAWLVEGFKRLRLNDATAGDWLIFRAVIPDQILISNMVPFKDNYDTVAGRWHLAGGQQMYYCGDMIIICRAVGRL